MAANEKLVRRIREALEGVPKLKEKTMFSGMTFMVDDKMCISVGPDRLMLRIDPGTQDELVELEGCKPVVMKGRELKGYIHVDESVLQTRKQLDYWTGLALDYNPKAKKSKKK
jgi:TfoX/Sxy family transcriptional regulator of competence genes